MVDNFNDWIKFKNYELKKHDQSTKNRIAKERLKLSKQATQKRLQQADERINLSQSKLVKVEKQKKLDFKLKIIGLVATAIGLIVFISLLIM